MLFLMKRVSMKLARCNEGDAKRLLSNAKIAFLPVGATEPHGDHLLLGTDTELADIFASRVASHFQDCSVILPVLPYSQVWSLQGFAGAIDIGNDLLSQLVVRIAHEIEQYGIHTLVVINTHFGNCDTLKVAARELQAVGIDLLTFSWSGTSEVIEKVRETPEAKQGYTHACEIETSIALALMPENVYMEHARANYPSFPTSFSYLPAKWTTFSDTATLGDPTQADSIKGMEIVGTSEQYVVTHLNEYLERKYDQ
ncbi:creatininase family protein [Aeromonas enteropelogenes]|uniref:creatininase family protein n=1 Tax=Aeromonas enteropelogenes TaxID=29489 RepID=UPI0031353C81